MPNLENVELADPAHDHARKLWLFSFYFAGMRARCVPIELVRYKEWTPVLHDEKNKKVVSLKISEKAAKILDHYR